MSSIDFEVKIWYIMLSFGSLKPIDFGGKAPPTTALFGEKTMYSSRTRKVFIAVGVYLIVVHVAIASVNLFQGRSWWAMVNLLSILCLAALVKHNVYELGQLKGPAPVGLPKAVVVKSR